MKQKISEFMDGELQELDASELFEVIKKDEVATHEWAVYHLIGDVMRQPELANSTINYAVKERLKSEPAILSPQRKSKQSGWQTWGVSMAATVSALGVVAWMSMQLGTGKTPQSFAELHSVKPAQISSESNDYVMAHQEFSYGPDMSGGAYYVRTVAHVADGR